jgi:hypothetical protein
MCVFWYPVHWRLRGPTSSLEAERKGKVPPRLRIEVLSLDWCLKCKHSSTPVPASISRVRLIKSINTSDWGPRWRSWLRHCATNRRVTGSIPDGVIGFFHWHNPVGRTMALGSTQPLTEMGTRNISWGVNASGA